MSEKRKVDPDRCATCGRSLALCVCDRVVPLPTRLQVVILQHPRERDVELGSAQLVAASLPNARIVVGLSWRSLEHALGEPADVSRWAVIFPAKDLPPEAAAQGFWLSAKDGTALGRRRLTGVIALDGTWSHAKTLWWRNPWLSRMPRLTLVPAEPSIYGGLRHEPKRTYVSTLEAVADALVATGEDPEVRTQLRRLFRTLVQRARDAKQKGRPTAKRAPR
jgi:DTW domain-containing protein